MRAIQFTGAVAGGIAIAAAGYTAYWFLAADAIENRVADWSESQRKDGWQLEAADTEVSGFPTRFSITLRDPIITADADGWSWRGDNLLAELRPWNFQEITLFVNGNSHVRVKDGEVWHDMDWHVEDGQAKLILTDDLIRETLKRDKAAKKARKLDDDVEFEGDGPDADNDN